VGGTRSRIYGPGDTVRMGVGIQHAMHLDEAVAVFVHEQQDGAELHLVGRPMLYEEQDLEALEAWRSEAEMSVTVPPGAVPGVYTLIRLALHTYGGRLFRYDREELGENAAVVSFEVVEEPTDRPIIEGIDYMKQ
jgi:hypothetical protein